MAMAALFLFFFVFSTASMAEDTESFIYAGCSQGKYAPDSPYELNVDSLLSSLANAAAFSPFAKFTSSAASPSSPVSGLFQCRADLPVPSCSDCVRSALNQLPPLCPSAAAATVQLSGCLIRYGNDSFLGKPDTTLLYKRCGPPAPPVSGPGGGGDLLGMRDDALAALSTAGPAAGYRVGAAGSVQAAAQCVGDISGRDCSDCVAAAVGQLKGACGYAAAGEAYLGKCYAKYSAGGRYGYSSKESRGDDAGKTLAIIIGLMAVVALIIIFLSFIRRAGNGGKY